VNRARGANNPFDRFAWLYDWEHDPYQADVEVLVALARRFGGPVLELACGTGRLLAPLAHAGLACTGVDNSPAMLTRARDRLVQLGLAAQLVEQSLEELELADRFRTIILGLDSLGLFVERLAQLRVLEAARRHATHDARLILDVANGNLRGGAEPASELLHDITAPDPKTGRPISKLAVRRPNPAEQLDELLYLYDEQDEHGYIRRTTVELRLRWFTRFELELLLERSGWRPSEVYGSYGLDPYGPMSDRLLVVSAAA
jgi:SAM-dependent methyltransferase